MRFDYTFFILSCMRVSWPYPVRTASGFPCEGTVLRAAPGDREAQSLSLFSAPNTEPQARFLGRPKVVFEGSVLATDEPFLIRYYGRGSDGDWGMRWLEARMGMDAGAITATLDKPSGVPMGWQHDVGYLDSPAPIGRVLTMEVSGGALIGDVALSPAELSKYLANSIEDVDLASGLSIGFYATEPPDLVLKEGSREDPDEMTYRAYRVFEASLVPIPALPSAGLGRRAGEAQGRDGGELDFDEEGSQEENGDG